FESLAFSCSLKLIQFFAPRIKTPLFILQLQVQHLLFDENPLDVLPRNALQLSLTFTESVMKFILLFKHSSERKGLLILTQILVFQVNLLDQVTHDTIPLLGKLRDHLQLPITAQSSSPAKQPKRIILPLDPFLSVMPLSLKPLFKLHSIQIAIAVKSHNDLIDFSEYLDRRRPVPRELLHPIAALLFCREIL
ncbi:4-hydroxybenzoate octaprenyltransferase, partial [Striga asiatica]